MSVAMATRILPIMMEIADRIWDCFDLEEDPCTMTLPDEDPHKRGLCHDVHESNGDYLFENMLDSFDVVLPVFERSLARSHPHLWNTALPTTTATLEFLHKF